MTDDPNNNPAEARTDSPKDVSDDAAGQAAQSIAAPVTPARASQPPTGPAPVVSPFVATRILWINPERKGAVVGISIAAAIVLLGIGTIAGSVATRARDHRITNVQFDGPFERMNPHGPDSMEPFGRQQKHHPGAPGQQHGFGRDGEHRNKSGGRADSSTPGRPRGPIASTEPPASPSPGA